MKLSVVSSRRVFLRVFSGTKVIKISTKNWKVAAKTMAHNVKVSRARSGMIGNDRYQSGHFQYILVGLNRIGSVKSSL